MTVRGRRITRVSVPALALLAALSLPRAAMAQSGDDGTASPPADLADLHGEVNRHRTAVGCPELEWHPPTARVAETHSRDMMSRDYFDHVAPGGVDPGERLLAGGVTWHGSIAENIARTPAGAASATELWLDSPPHRENIERCEFTHHGVGGFGDRWTQVLVQRPGP